MSKVSEVVRRIKKETNCYKMRDGANHEIWINPETGKKFTIPRHYGKELPTKTAKSILKDAGLS